MLRFQKWYFLIAILLFLVELLIAVFIDDSIIRPYGGDFLVVMLIYCFIRSFLRIPVLKLAFSVLLFSYILEVCQYFRLVKLLGLGQSTVLRVSLGTTFEWVDLLAYTLGILVVIGVEKIRLSNMK